MASEKEVVLCVLADMAPAPPPNNIFLDSSPDNGLNLDGAALPKLASDMTLREGEGP